jgi:hypothetical protein
MRIRKKDFLILSFLVFIGLWIATYFFGRKAVDRRIVDKEIHERLFVCFYLNRSSNETYPHQPADYYRIQGADESDLRYPAYQISTWTPFPFIVVSRYYIAMGPSLSSSEFSRVYLWFLGPIAEFEERLISAS